MCRFHWVYCFIVSLTVLVPVAGAQTGVRIGVVEVQSFLEASEQYRKITAEAAQRQRVLNELFEQRRAIQMRYEQNSATLSSQETEALRQELIDVTRKLGTAQEEAREFVDNSLEKNKAAIMEEVRSLIEQNASRVGYDLVFQTPVIHSSPQLDVTAVLLGKQGSMNWPAALALGIFDFDTLLAAWLDAEHAGSRAALQWAEIVAAKGELDARVRELPRYQPGKPNGELLAAERTVYDETQRWQKRVAAFQQEFQPLVLSFQKTTSNWPDSGYDLVLGQAKPAMLYVSERAAVPAGLVASNSDTTISNTEGSPDLKIGLVDVTRLGAALPDMQEDRSAYERERASLSENREALQKRWREAQGLSGAEQMAAMQRVEADSNALKQATDRFNGHQARYMRQVGQRAAEVVVTFGREQGYDLIMTAKAPVYASERLDITESLIQAVKK